MSKKRNGLGFWICLFSVICSIGIHIYLANHHYDFKFGQSSSEGLCNINEKFNCTATTSSQFSEFLGVPLSVFALWLHGILLILLIGLKLPLFDLKSKQSFQNSIKFLAGFTVLSSLVMAFISIFILKTICPMCSAAYFFSFTLILGVTLSYGLKPIFDFSALKSLGIMGGFILLLSFAYNSNKMQQYGGKDVQEMIQLQFEEWKNSPEKSITPISPLKLNANENAKIKMVEFADFLCGHCATAFPMIHEFAKSNPDIELSFQPFPLDGECNSVIQYVSGASCYLARVAHCAGLQDQGWQTQKWIFKNQRNLVSKESAEKLIEESAPELSLNWEELKTCEKSDETKELIKKQAQLGVDIGVKGTPALYINGKKVPSGFAPPVLNKIKSDLTK